MLDHPAINNPDYTTAIVSWFDGGLHWFQSPPLTHGMVILDVYYLSYAIAIFFGYLIARKAQQKGLCRLQPYQVYDGVLVFLVSILLGAKLGYVIFYQPGYYLKHPDQILTNWSGMASHGAIGGLLIGYWLWARRIKIPYLHVVDNAVIGGAFSAFFIRMANFLNGELYGRSVDPELPWSMRFYMRDDVGQPLFADSANNTYALVTNVKGDKVLRHLEPLEVTENFTRLTEAPVTHYPVGDAKVPIDVWRMVTDARHPSQLYQMILTGVVFVAILFFIRKRTQYVGTLTGAFFIGYGIVRFISEFFRQPDPQLGFVALGLSMGQLLSFAVIAIGALILRYRAKHPLKIVDIPMDTPRTTQSN